LRSLNDLRSPIFVTYQPIQFLNSRTTDRPNTIKIARKTTILSDQKIFSFVEVL